MTRRNQAIANAIAGFLDRDALGAATWSTPQEGARLLLEVLLPIIDAPDGNGVAHGQH